MIRRLLNMWPTAAAYLWLYMIGHYFGAPAAFFSAITGLIVAGIAFWEAGSKSTPEAPL